MLLDEQDLLEELDLLDQPEQRDELELLVLRVEKEILVTLDGLE